MQKDVILITGAAGEIGQALVTKLAGEGNRRLVTLDIKELPPEDRGKSIHILGSVADEEVISALDSRYEFERIYHMAALLSTKAEKVPALGSPGECRRQRAAAGISRAPVGTAGPGGAVRFPQLYCCVRYARPGD